MKRVEDGDGVLSLAPDDEENSLDDSWSLRRLGKHYLPNTTYQRLYTYSPLLHCRHEIDSYNHTTQSGVRDHTYAKDRLTITSESKWDLAADILDNTDSY